MFRMFLLLVLSCMPLCAQDFERIFEGNTLQGWEGDMRFWSAKDGILRGETRLDAMPKENTFLIWKNGTVKDFELKISFRIQNGNSGIQYRSKDLGGFRVSGYQAEVENTPGKVGFLYHERGRKHLVKVGEIVESDPAGKLEIKGRTGTAQELIAKGYYKEKGWNEYRIVARGNRIEHWLNGFQVVDLTENFKDEPQEGILALQIHTGPPMVVEFKDIFLKTLTPAK